MLAMLMVLLCAACSIARFGARGFLVILRTDYDYVQTTIPYCFFIVGKRIFSLLDVEWLANVRNRLAQDGSLHYNPFSCLCRQLVFTVYEIGGSGENHHCTYPGI